LPGQNWKQFNQAQSAFRVSGTANWGEARILFDRINQHRAAQNPPLQPLIFNQAMATSAMQRAGETYVFFDHMRPNGVAFENFFFSLLPAGLVSAGARGSENLAGSDNYASSGLGAFNQWLNSPGHNRIMLMPDQGQRIFAGVGFVQVPGNGFRATLLVVSTNNDFHRNNFAQMSHPGGQASAVYTVPFNRTFYNSRPNTYWHPATIRQLNHTFGENR